MVALLIVEPDESEHAAPFAHGDETHSSISIAHVPPIAMVQVLLYCDVNASP
jgi:hypothetical protein